MQLYALNSSGQVIHARQAKKQTNYGCIECHQTVRLRGGPYRQSHFYHLDPTPSCRQSQKGPIHLHLQTYFMNQLSSADCLLEARFPAIQRIADVAWPSQKIIFEIQCSPISGEEVIARNQDYQKIGWRVIWILHDHRYNQTRLSSAELALASSPHFFTNMDASGKGILYDQFDICQQGIRLERLSPLPLEIHHDSIQQCPPPPWPLKLIQKRAEIWNLSLKGDLLSLSGQNPSSSYLKQAYLFEKRFFPSPLAQRSLLFFQLWQNAIYRPCRAFFQFFLEQICK